MHGEDSDEGRGASWNRAGQRIRYKNGLMESHCLIRDFRRPRLWAGRGDAKMQRSTTGSSILRIPFIFQILACLSHKTVSVFCATVIWKRSKGGPDVAGLCCVCVDVE